MKLEMLTVKQIESYSVKEIDDVIKLLDNYSMHYKETNNLNKMIKVVELQGILIDIRCKKLGIVL